MEENIQKNSTTKDNKQNKNDTSNSIYFAIFSN